MTARNRTIRVSTMGALALLLSLAAPHAGAEEQATVIGQGTSIVERQPELLRMQLEIHAKASDLKTALSRLAERRAQAAKLLVELGAEQGSLKFGSPHVSPQAMQRQQQMRMMVAQQLRGRGGKPKEAAETPEPVTLVLSVRAEWPLTGTEPDDLLLKTHELQKKIKAADLAGKKELEQPTEEEEESAAEAQQTYFDPSEQQIGDAVFVYVAKIPAPVRKQAITEAFIQAKAKAEDLAQAAGASIGSLRELKCMEQAGPNLDGMASFNNNYYNSMAYRLAQQAAGMFAAGGNPEAVGAEPGLVRFGISVDASFLLK